MREPLTLSKTLRALFSSAVAIILASRDKPKPKSRDRDVGKIWSGLPDGTSQKRNVRSAARVASRSESREKIAE
jgi:hypothetical protein